MEKKNLFEIKFIFIWIDEYKFGGYGRGINEFLEPNGIAFLSDGTIAVVDTNSSQVKLFDRVRRECTMKFGQAGTRPGALLYPYRIAVLPGHDLVKLIFFLIKSFLMIEI